MSPEVLGALQNGRKMKVGRRTDVWSFGCIIIQMIMGKPPQFSDETGDRTVGPQIMYFVGNGGAPTIPDRLPRNLDQLIRDCLVWNPRQRPYATQLRDGSFQKFLDATTE